ncbi:MULTISPECIES: fluoride efflux transporter CrcB [Aneurinibacillus]|uniref:Fluoride-specific ion channel FluC n=1 Tax=Aneurinibacillus danicus TaxID=267746 RepID=A0A511V5N0_9BACL|nr:fluoride efflux transporter CrcB [Aneurinibacillus danicus]GEN34039.1 putative fluoride ion transporter CrcB 2 [Aneurinibacillus danicus]
MSMILLIGLGGVIGTISRFYLGKWVTSKSNSLFPWGTFIINISGSFILGILFFLHTRGNVANWLWLMLGTGFCGGYTTFSTFSYETVQLMQKKQLLYALGYVLLSIVGGLLFCWIGMNVGELS